MTDDLAGSGFLHALPLLRADYRHWIILYNIGNIHFRLGALKHAHSDEATVAFRQSDLPQALRDAFNEAHRRRHSASISSHHVAPCVVTVASAGAHLLGLRTEERFLKSVF